MPLTARTRKLLLLVHIAAAGVWLGLDLVLGIFVVTVLTGDATGAGAAAASLAAVATWPLVVAGLVTLASGVLLGLGSKYGLMRYRWVLVKLVVGSGVAEIGLGAALVALPRERERIGTIVAAFFIAVFPGNLAQWAERRSAFRLTTDRARFIRLFFQPLLVGLAVWSTLPAERRG